VINKEVWMPIPSAKGYEVSSLGRVKSIPRTILTSNGQSRSYKGHILAITPHAKGYSSVTLGRGKEGSLIHRLVLEAFVGPCPEEMECRHLNGIKTDNMVSNLCWGTPLENGEDRIRHGTTTRKGAKLTPNLVPHIRQLLREGRTQKDIGSIYGVRQAAISDIALGLTWKGIV